MANAITDCDFPADACDLNPEDLPVVLKSNDKARRMAICQLAVCGS